MKLGVSRCSGRDRIGSGIVAGGQSAGVVGRRIRVAVQTAVRTGVITADIFAGDAAAGFSLAFVLQGRAVVLEARERRLGGNVAEVLL